MLKLTIPSSTLVYGQDQEENLIFQSHCITNAHLPEDKSFTKVELWKTVTEIGHLCFEGCEELTSITLPSTISSIGYNAFRGCDKLQQVIIPENIDEIKVWFSSGVQMRMYPPFDGIADLLKKGYCMEFNPPMSWNDWN